MNMRYGVQFEPETLDISAGVVRRSQDRDVFVTKCTVSEQVVAAACLWVLSRWGNKPCRFVNAQGVTFELSVKVVT